MIKTWFENKTAFVLRFSLFVFSKKALLIKDT